MVCIYFAMTSYIPNVVKIDLVHVKEKNPAEINRADLKEMVQKEIKGRAQH